MSPARAYVVEVLGLDPGSASPTSGYGDRLLLRVGLSGQFGGSIPRLGMLYYRNRAARIRQHGDPWAAAVVLAAEEDSHLHGERGSVTLQAAAALVLASGDAWLVGYVEVIL